MSRKLKIIFIGGAPGVGKSEVANELHRLLDNCIWLDGDDVWNMNPFVVNDRTIHLAESNIKNLLKSYLEFGFSYIIFTWILHSDQIIQKLLSDIDNNQYEFHHFTLMCDEIRLKERIEADIGRTTDIDLAMKRLRQTQKVNSEKINTTSITSNQIAAMIKEKTK